MPTLVEALAGIAESLFGAYVLRLAIIGTVPRWAQIWWLPRNIPRPNKLETLTVGIAGGGFCFVGLVTIAHACGVFGLSNPR
jgi:hypothetical protein